jgi:tetratricopeptide (TPR) repeat protein
MNWQPGGAPIEAVESGGARPGLLRRAAASDGLFAIVIAAAVLLTYLPVLSAGFVWDDNGHVTRPELRTIHGLWRIWFEPGATQQYYPVLHTAFWVEHRIWGDSPVGYHLLNVLLHAAVAWLFLLVLRRIGVPGARLAALAFALHPVCVESVAWISEQKNTLSALFYFSAALAYFRFERRRGTGGYLLAILLFALAVGTKTVTATLPAALLVVIWWKKGRLSWRTDAAPLVPWLLLGGLAGWVTAHVERIYIGATGTAFDLTFTERILIAGRVILFYLGKVFWPTGLVFIYPHWSVDGRVPSLYVYPAAVVLALAILFALRHRWRGPLCLALLYVGTLFPALGFVNVYPFTYSYVADHFQYLAAAIAIAGAASGLASLAAYEIGKSRLAPLAMAGLAFALALLSRIQCRQYADAETLWRTTIEKNPDCGMARGNLAGILLQTGRIDEAVAQYRAVLGIARYRDSAEAHYNLGCALMKLPGHAADAGAELEEALRLKPSYAQAHFNLGHLLEAEPGHLAQAISEYQTALRLDPNDAETQCSLAGALQVLPDRADEAMAHYEVALRLKPDFFQARYGLAFALARIPGRRDEAIVQYREALKLRPESAEAHFDLARILQDIPGRLDESIGQYEESLRLKPNAFKAEANLGNALYAAGRREEAIAHLRQAAKIEPDNAQIHFNLGVFLLNIPGRTPEGMAEIRETLRLDPSNALARQIIDRARSLGR